MLIKDISWIARKAQGICQDISPKAKERLHEVESFVRLRKEGCSEKTALSTLKVSRASIYRWKSSVKRQGLLGLEHKSTRPRRHRKACLQDAIRPRVAALYKQYPRWGPEKISTLLTREKIYASKSTVCRVIKKLSLTPEQKILLKKNKRRRQFDGKHAQRWKSGMKGVKPGELIQMDHMTVNVAPGRSIKHFQATCPVSKVTVAEAYSTASSAAGARFLRKVEEKMPFTIESIQVDGGSEFMKDFEKLCEEREFPLFVLPPKSPKLNGCVERRNRTLREEFYAFYDGEGYLEDVRKKLDEYLHIYNDIRPHQALGNLTPKEYLQEHWQEMI